MSGFTPGPWEVRCQFIGPRLAPDSSIQVRVARVNDDYEDPEAQANARLIAAAPELYEALERLVEDVANKWGDPHTFEEAILALAKASGADA